MTKNTMANKLPRKLTQKMQIVGEQIRLARLRRNLSMAQVAERATCSEVTLCKVEKGLPTVSIGIYPIDYLPITTTLNNLSNNKGDLVKLEKVEIYDDTNGDLGLGSVHLLKSGYTYALISNYDEIADQITDANGQYFVTAWYNGAQGAIASVKVVAVQQALGAPVITAAEPTFTESTTVTITTADGATIYYTTDGTTPTVGGATTQVYTVPFTINKTTTIKAIAV